MTNGGYLTRQQILEAKDTTYAEVSVPEWGGMVRVKLIGASEEGTFLEKLAMAEQRMGIAADPNLAGRLHMIATQTLKVTFCAFAICDQHGNRIFDEADVEALGKRSPSALDRVFAVAANLYSEARKSAGEGSGAVGSSDESSSLPAGPDSLPAEG